MKTLSYEYFSLFRLKLITISFFMFLFEYIHFLNTFGQSITLIDHLYLNHTWMKITSRLLIILFHYFSFASKGQTIETPPTKNKTKLLAYV